MTLVAWKRIGLLLASALVVSTPSLAGIEDEFPTVDDLRVPASPAFILLDVSPTSVERPNTPRAFALGLLSATERGDSTFPQDLAMEIAPYWWKSHPDLTFRSYYGLGGQKKTLGSTIVQTLAISLATTDLQETTGVEGTRSGLGVRFMFLQGRPAPDLEVKVEEAVKNLKKLQLKLLEECVPDDPEAPDSEPDPVCTAEHESKLKPAAKAVTKEVDAMNKERVGWMVEFASALTADFPDNDGSQADVNRVGAWLTASYNGKPRSLTFVGVARHFREDTPADTVGRSDLGARLIWKADPTAMPPLGLSLEYVRRFTPGEGDTDKLVAVLEVPLPLDNLSVVASYGKDFGDDATGKEDLVSTLGINFGLGRGPVVRLPGTP